MPLYTKIINFTCKIRNYMCLCIAWDIRSSIKIAHYSTQLHIYHFTILVTTHAFSEAVRILSYIYIMMPRIDQIAAAQYSV